jgi:5'-nucleotidase
MEQRTDPRGKPYFWIGGEGRPEYATCEGTDAKAVQDGYASATPLNMDLTCRAAMADGSLFDNAFRQ